MACFVTPNASFTFSHYFAKSENLCSTHRDAVVAQQWEVAVSLSFILECGGWQKQGYGTKEKTDMMW